ncbi:hypothetical protein [Nonomuraea insulae]|uniref:Secreted protein n=1 Tax=Nonomuraea insulae TaxID=1616787 RepID=A0ABW1CSD8_9ACTN
MNTNIRQPRYGRFAALAMAGAAAAVMFLPLGVGVASASAGYSTVQAGGPPSAPAPVKHVYKPRYVPREKPILRMPHHRPPNIDVFIHNRSHNDNKRHRFDHRRRENVRPEVVRPAPVKPEPPVKEEPVKEEHGEWWWPDELE